MNRVVVIGGGLGGLSAAIHLAHAGVPVTVCEKNDIVGGKMGIFKHNNFVFDTGPSLLTMPSVIHDLFASVGRTATDYLDIRPVNPLCRYFFSDGSVLDAYSDREEMKKQLLMFNPEDTLGFFRFLDHGERIFRASAQPFLISSFGSWTGRDFIKNIRHLPAVLRIDALRTLNDAVCAHVKDATLRQLFNRFATYNGSSPYLAPATLAIIPYIEFTQGGWYLQGGMYSLARALHRLAIECGVEIRANTEVERIGVAHGAVNGVHLLSGEFIPAGTVVSNADAIYSHTTLLKHTPYHARYANARPSLAGFVLLLGVRGKYEHFAHHNVFFSGDYPGEFRTLGEGRLPDDPTIYVSIPSSSDSSLAPEGMSALFVLVNTPPLPPESGEYRNGVHWERDGAAYAQAIIQRLEDRGMDGLSGRIVLQKALTPLDFQRRYNAFRGSIYGPSSDRLFSAFLRPPNKSRHVRGLYFAGGSSHPGGGIPLVLLSGKIVAGLITQEEMTA